MDYQRLVWFLFLFDLSTCLMVGPVRLAHRKRYISFEEGPSPDNSLLECHHTLEGDEEVQDVFWKVFKEDEVVGEYSWSVGGEATASGILENFVRVDREDGNLEFTILDYELGGKYSCGVTTTNGLTDETAPWEVLIIHETSDRIDNELSGDIPTCTIRSSLTLYPIFPEPTVHSGLYSAEMGGFFDQVSGLEWHKVHYENGSVAYSYDEKVFQVDKDTPLDTVFLTTVGVTKSDNNYISLQTIRSFDQTWQERGCPSLRLQEYQLVEYSTEKTTCRGKRLPSGEDPLTARIFCDEGYKPVGDVDEVVVTCDDMTWSWVGIPGQPRRRELRCVIDNSSSLSRLHPASFLLTAVLLLCYFQH